jgi:hypothetical protein
MALIGSLAWIRTMTKALTVLCATFTPQENMAGVVGLEPTDHGIKTRCLTDLAILLHFYNV